MNAFSHFRNGMLAPRKVERGAVRGMSRSVVACRNTNLHKREETAVITRSMLLNLFVLALLTVTLTACSDTWEGLKQDTGENLEATGEAIEDAGEAIKPE